MFCWKCGKELADGQRFCGHCGADQSARPSGPETPFDGEAPRAPEPPGTERSQPERDEAYAPQGQSPYMGYGRLQTDRNLLMYILLNIVTCGIYSFYFVYRLGQDVNIACEGDGNRTSDIVTYILLSIVTCGIYSIVWYYMLANRLAANAPRYGFEFQENGTTVLLWYVFGILICGIGPLIAIYIIIKNTNSICMAYNQYNNL